jgi:hypothetical protein
MGAAGRLPTHFYQPSEGQEPGPYCAAMSQRVSSGSDRRSAHRRVCGKRGGALIDGRVACTSEANLRLGTRPDWLLPATTVAGRWTSKRRHALIWRQAKQIQQRSRLARDQNGGFSTISAVTSCSSTAFRTGPVDRRSADRADGHVAAAKGGVGDSWSPHPLLG